MAVRKRKLRSTPDAQIHTRCSGSAPCRAGWSRRADRQGGSPDRCPRHKAGHGRQRGDGCAPAVSPPRTLLSLSSRLPSLPRTAPISSAGLLSPLLPALPQVLPPAALSSPVLRSSPVLSPSSAVWRLPELLIRATTRMEREPGLTRVRPGFLFQASATMPRIAAEARRAAGGSARLVSRMGTFAPSTRPAAQAPAKCTRPL